MRPVPPPLTEPGEGGEGARAGGHVLRAAGPVPDAVRVDGHLPDEHPGRHQQPGARGRRQGHLGRTDKQPRSVSRPRSVTQPGTVNLRQSVKLQTGPVNAIIAIRSDGLVHSGVTGDSRHSGLEALQAHPWGCGVSFLVTCSCMGLARRLVVMIR